MRLQWYGGTVLNLAPQYAAVKNGYHPGLGTTASTAGASPFATTSGTASFAIGEAGGILAAITPLIPALAAIPGFGAIVAAGTALVATVVSMFKGCGQTCTLTSQASDQIQSQIAQLMAAYFASGRTQSEQAAALQAFDQMWAQLEQYCGQASMGSAGQNCIGDRQAGACKWKSSPPTFNGCSFVGSGAAGSGTWCFNWFSGFRDQIANDPCVQPDTTASTQVASAMTQALNMVGISSSTLSSASIGPLLIAGAAILLLMVL